MRSFLKKASLYAVPDMLGKALPFFILPIITRHLSLEDFGYVALFGLLYIPFSILSEFGSGYIMNALWFREGLKERKELLFALIVIRLGLLLLAGAALVPLAEKIYPAIVGEDWPKIASLFPWFLLFALSSFIPPIFTSWIVLEGRAKQFAIIGAAQSIATSLTTLFTAMTGDYRMVIIGGVLVGTAFSLVRLAILIPHVSPRINRAHIPVILRMGWPIFVRSAFNQIKGKFDKVYLASLYGGASFALYNWAHSAYRAYPTLESHLSKVFEPSYLRQLEEGRVDLGYLRRLFFAWFYLVLTGCTGFYFVGEQAIALVTNGVFSGAYEPLLLFTCIAMLGTLLIGQAVPIVHSRRTEVIMVATFCSAGIGVGSALFFIPRFGPKGAALSLFLAHAGTLSVYLAGRFRVFPKWIIEREIFPYLLVYWILIGLRVFNQADIGIPLSLLLAAASTHLFKRGGLVEIQSLISKLRRRGKPASSEAAPANPPVDEAAANRRLG